MLTKMRLMYFMLKLSYFYPILLFAYLVYLTSVHYARECTAQLHDLGHHLKVISPTSLTKSSTSSVKFLISEISQSCALRIKIRIDVFSIKRIFNRSHESAFFQQDLSSPMEEERFFGNFVLPEWLSSVINEDASCNVGS